jgi:hypothetical protein
MERKYNLMLLGLNAVMFGAFAVLLGVSVIQDNLFGIIVNLLFLFWSGFMFLLYFERSLNGN